jgi:hypothetical protein
MNERFAEAIQSLQPSLERLLAMEPVTTANLPRDMPKSGVYLFTEAADHLYVGRSNRLRSRICRHGALCAKQNAAALAFRIARETTGKKQPSYKPADSRKALVQQPAFARAFSEAKARIRTMEVRYIGEPDQLRQALLQIYVAVTLGTPFNDFDTQ